MPQHRSRSSTKARRRDVIASSLDQKPLNRNRACLACRYRKKRCDGKQPVCASCERLKQTCIYNKIPSGSPSKDEGHLGSIALSGSSAQVSNQFYGGVSTENLPANQHVSEHGHSPPVNLPHETNAMESSQHRRNLNIPGAVDGSPFDRSLSQLDPSFFFPATNFPGMDFQFWMLPEDQMHMDQADEDGRHQAHPSNVTAPRTHPYADNDEPLMTTISQDEPAPSSDSAELPSKGVKQTFPSRQMMQELVELFFSDIHKYLPCLHRSKFLADIDEEGALERPTALILSVLAAATSIHPDPGLKRNGADWNTQAKRMFDSAVTQGQFSLPNLQAAVWMIFYGFIVADMAEVWVLLGKAYRMACPLGFHQIDTKRTGVVGFARPPRTLEEKEERRRVMWALYLLDRGLSSGCGWPLAINDRHFMVNFPIEDDVFQSADNEDFANAFSEPFVHASFTSPTFSSPNGDSQTCYSLVLKINVLMGRIMEYNNDPDPFSCPEQRSNEFDELVAQLTRFSVSLPPKYTSLLGTSKAEGGMLLWLNFLLHSCFVLLHHPTVSESSSSSSLSNVRSPTSVSPGSVPNGAQSSEFLRCLAAVKNIIALINDAAIISSESLLNPFFAPIYAVCARILVVHFLETGDQTSRSNIDLLLLVLDRMPWTAMVNKYKNTTLRDLTRDPRSVNHIKISNGNYLEPECAPASMQSEEYHGRIPNVAQR